MASPSSRPQARRSALRFTGLAVLSVAIAGCTPRTQRAVEPIQPQPAQPISRLPPGETLNRVAVLVPLTGPAAQVGQSILNAANLALADTGVERIRILSYDTGPGAARAASTAIAQGAGLILGPLLAEDVRLVAPIAAAADVPVISFSNDVSVAGDGVYLMGLNPAQSVDRVVNYARGQGAGRFAALVPSSLYGSRVSDSMRVSVGAARGEFVGTQSYDRSATALRESAATLRRLGPFDAVLLADGTRTAVQAAPLVRGDNRNLRILGTELWAAEANGGGNAQLRGAWYAAASDTLFNQLRTRYRARYNRDPVRLASLGYDATLLAIRIAANWPLGRPFPEGELRDRQGFVGVDGAFRFGRDGVAERALEVRQLTANGFTVVSPAPTGFN